ncbi:hypothetical protein PENTCL1PPCAC_19122, partial [Pristionchus entomophagus]
IESIVQFSLLNIQDLRFDDASIITIVKTIIANKRVGIWHLKTSERFKKDELMPILGDKVEVHDDSSNTYERWKVKLCLDGFLMFVTIDNFEEDPSNVSVSSQQFDK